MQANSRSITSGQIGPHRHLSVRVARHAANTFLKPITDYNREAFERSIAVWQQAGAPPLILDAGCGIGLSTHHLALQFSDHFVIGIDQSADRLARGVAWPAATPTNLLLLRADLVDYWRLLLQTGIRPARHYVLYPNPWPKIGHLARRWHAHPVFPTLIALGGHFECRSNWAIYIDECAAALSQLCGANVEGETFYPTMSMTPFENKYLLSGHRLWRCRVALDVVSTTTNSPSTTRFAKI